MDLLYTITVGQVISAFLVCALLREIIFVVAHELPDSVAGPGGWLVDTGPNGPERD